MVRARFLAIGAGVCLQPPRGDLVSVWGRWAGRDGGERTQQEAFADRTGASSRGRSVGRMAAGCRRRRQAGSGRARNRARARLNWVSQGQRRGEMQSEAARRAGDPSHQSEDPPPEGLGDHGPLAQTNPRLQRARLCAITWTASQAPLAAKRADGMWFSPTPYLRSRMTFSTSAWRR